ncbi:TPA: hypothetical protein ACNRZ2_005045, partial [Escherichia coli]
ISDNHLDILYNAYACNAHAQQGIHHWRLQTRVLHLKESGLALRHQHESIESLSLLSLQIQTDNQPHVL